MADTRQHLSLDGKWRVCTAQTPDACPLTTRPHLPAGNKPEDLLSVEFLRTNPAFVDLLKGKKEEDPYLTSDFLPLKTLSTRTKGTKFEQLAAELLKSYGFKVQKALNSGHDRLVEDHKVEIKGSFLWGSSGSFKWQQIRPSQDYEYLLFMSFYPQRLDMHLAKAADASSFVQQQDGKGNWPYNQHGGKKVNSGTFFLNGTAAKYPWMRQVLPGMSWSELTA